MFERFDEPESPDEGTCIRYLMDRHCPIRWNRPVRGEFKIYVEPESPNGRGVFIRSVVNNIGFLGFVLVVSPLTIYRLLLFC